MIKILLDTNICIYLMKNKQKSINEKFAKYEKGEIAISSISAAELFLGVEKSAFKIANQSKLETFLSFFEILNFDGMSAIWYAKIRAELEKQGKIIGNMDMLIASIALSNDLTLITNNIKEFKRVNNLKLDNWM